MQIEMLYKYFLNSTGVTTDTRKIESGNIFFALKGEKFNANEFAEEAFSRGAKYVVVEELKNEGWNEKFSEQLVVVNNVLETLQQLSGYHRQQLKCPVLAITGSNGKTTTKELIASVLSKKYKIYATKGNWNNHIGIPLTLLAIQPDVEFAVIEMGANHQQEITSYCKYVKPDYGLITNIGNAHLEGFGGFEGVVKGKTELYADLKTRNGKIFINADNQILLSKILELGYQISDSKQVITYGKVNPLFCSGEIINGDEFLKIRAEGENIQTNLIGDYNFENIMSAVCVGKYFGVELKQIKEAIENYVPQNNRSQKITFGTNTIILDAYNANPSSMAVALKNFENIKSANKVAIIGQMMELGKFSFEAHKKIATSITDRSIKKIFVGKEFEFVKQMTDENLNKSSWWFETTEEVKNWFKKQRFENTFILIKGSRKNELEKILKD